MPRRAAGMPNWLFAEAMRRSACMAIASPPPRQKPWIAAMLGLGEAREPGAAAAGQPRVFLLGIGVRAPLLELADVGARHERLAARAGHDDHPHRRVRAKIIEDFREP